MTHESRMFLFNEPRLVPTPVMACGFVVALLHGIPDHGGS